MNNNTDKLKQAVKELTHALSFENKAFKDSFYFSGITKCFETCFEYAWKYFKQKVNAEGLEAYSPKEAIKRAGQLELIKSVETWLEFLEARNNAVHDYFGFDDKDYLEIIKKFYKEIITLKL